MNKNNENSEECKLMLKKNNNIKYEKIKDYKKWLIKIKSNYIILIAALFIIIFIYFIVFKKEKNYPIEESQNNSLIINDTIINELNKFIQICKDGTLLYGIEKPSQNPKITALIPVYNAGKTIKTTIRSIQNQNMSDIEILIVDDCSNDNSLQIIEQLQSEDPRIKLLKSKKNRGTLYTRSIGALNSKGKYVMTIDNDDLFINNILQIAYDEAELNNIDIIEFSGYNTYQIYLLANSTSSSSLTVPHYLQFKQDGVIIKQPQLSSFLYQMQNNNSDNLDNSDNFTLIDGLIWGKCINSDIYRKALDLIGDIIYAEKVVWCEDRIVNFALFRVANSFKFINIDGIIHYVAESTAGHKLRNEKRNQIFHEEFINVMSIFNITKNSPDIKFAVFEFKNAWKLYFFGLNEDNKKFAMSIFGDIVNCTNISSKSREELMSIVKNTLKNEKEMFKYYKNIFEP